MTSDTFDGGFIEAMRGARYAGFGVRFGAYIIDFLCLIPVIGASFYFSSVAPNPIAYLGIMILLSLYKPIMEGLYGATLGKMATKIKIVNADGAQINMQQALIRWIPFLVGGLYSIVTQYTMISAAAAEGVSGYMDTALFNAEYMAENGMGGTLIGSALGFLPLVSVLFLFGNEFKQALHDKWASTFVIYKEPKDAGTM